MKLFNIYTKKSKDNSIEDLIVVQSNFSYLAFFFNIFWFVQHKMWKEASVLIFINAILITIFQKGFFGLSELLILEAGLLIIVGLNAGYWYEQYLTKKIYHFSGSVFGKNKDEAKLRFISNCFKDNESSGIFCSSIGNFENKKITNSFF